LKRITAPAILYLVGIRRRGVPLAERMADKIADLEGDRPPVGILDITLYRDDLSTVGAKPIVNRTDLPGDIENRNIVLIDDVLYTGRTIRAALDQLIDFRPAEARATCRSDRSRQRASRAANPGRLHWQIGADEKKRNHQSDAAGIRRGRRSGHRRAPGDRNGISNSGQHGRFFCTC
jgi:hypoxanthine phosphoribosyltransferase